MIGASAITYHVIVINDGAVAYYVASSTNCDPQWWRLSDLMTEFTDESENDI